jgi:predicted DNA-binding ribbon-helix-helix protein
MPKGSTAVRKTLTLDDDVHKAAKQIAKERGITLGQTISELARQGMLLRQQEEARRAERRVRSGRSAGS